MKTFKLLLKASGAVILPLAFISCANDGTPSTDGLPIAIHPSVSSHTRATEAAFEAGDKIGVTITLDGAADAAPWQENAELTYNGKYFESEDIKWFSRDNKGVFEAYYPFDKDYSGGVDILTDQTGDGYSDSDVLIALATNVSPNVNGVSLSFIHAMAQLVVKVYNNTDFEITEVVVGDTKVEAAINITSLNTTARKMSEIDDITAQQISGDTFRAILVPQTVEAVITVRTEGGHESSITLPSTEYQTATSYRAVMTLTEDFDITDVDITSRGEIESWQDGGLVNPS